MGAQTSKGFWVDDQRWKSEGSCLSRERAFGSDCFCGNIERGGSEFDNEKINPMCPNHPTGANRSDQTQFGDGACLLQPFTIRAPVAHLDR
jgi:hypothetical protein